MTLRREFDPSPCLAYRNGLHATQVISSIILPVIDETESLRETVKIVIAENPGHIREILLIVCQKTTPESMRVCNQLAESYPDLVRTYSQKRPYLGGAMQDAFSWAGGTHIVMMASDLETDPRTVKDLIQKACEGYDVVTATRWAGDGGFRGYEPVKYLLNWIFQKSFRLLYRTSLSDLTYGFRIFKAEWVRQIAWEEYRHPFLLETILKPLRLGAQIAEVPTTWCARSEGQSHNTFWRNFVYFRIALKTRIRPRGELLARAEA